jgi:Mitogen-activated protein kinase kinase 1 interacting
MASVALLPAALQNSLQEIVDQSNQAAAEIRAILLSTAEGVPLGRVYASTSTGSSSDQHQQLLLNEEVLASIESVWAPASKQFPVLGLGNKVHQVTAMYDHGILMHVYQTPLVVTILCGPHAHSSNLGAIRSTTIPLLKQALEPLCTTLVESLKPDYESSATAYYQ